MLKDKTSILIVSSDGSSNKKITVPTFLVKNWKKIISSFFLFMVTLTIGTVYYFKTKASEYYTSVYNGQIESLKKVNKKLSYEEAASQLSLQEVKKSFNLIDSTLDEINVKMRKRGLKDITPKNVGGPVETNDNLNELTKYYETTVKHIDRKLSALPVGVPHHGRITSRFGYRRNPFTNRGRELHSGVDFKGRKGDPVKVTAKGQVSFAGYMGDYGYVVMVNHSEGFETRYAHLSKLKVKKGDRIDVGEVVGLVGNTGRSTGSHLHYEILHRGKKINPQNYFYF